MNKEILGWIVAGTLAILLFMDRCGERNGGGSSPLTDTVRVETKTVTFRDSVIIHHWHATKETYYKDSTDTKTPEEAAFDYYVMREHVTTYSDSAITWRARATVWQNKIQDFRLDYQFTSTTRTITLREAPSTHIWLGAFAGGGQGFDYGPQAILMDKKGRAYTVNYSLVDKSVRVGLGLKLK
jgi:hypothetical protein